MHVRNEVGGGAIYAPTFEDTVDLRFLGLKINYVKENIL